MHGAYTNTTSNRQLDVKYLNENIQKQPSRSVLKKKCSENVQQLYGRAPIPSAVSIKL